MNDSMSAKLHSQVQPGQLIVKKVTSFCSCSLSQHNIAIKKASRNQMFPCSLTSLLAWIMDKLTPVLFLLVKEWLWRHAFTKWTYYQSSQQVSGWERQWLRESVIFGMDKDIFKEKSLIWCTKLDMYMNIFFKRKFHFNRMYCTFTESWGRSNFVQCTCF